jgi:argininosuccinate lyase
MALLMLMKGQPLAYNKDNQEDKEPLFDTADTILDTLRVFAEMMAGLEVKKDVMRAAALEGYSTATDLADYLVKKGLPFRDAQHKDLSEMEIRELQDFSPLITQDVFDVLKVEGSVAARQHTGGTAPSQVHLQVDAHKKSSC